jgi:hypothetical protein
METSDKVKQQQSYLGLTSYLLPTASLLIHTPTSSNRFPLATRCTEVPGLMFCAPPLAMSAQSRAENIAHTAMYTYKGGGQNISLGTSVEALEHLDYMARTPTIELRVVGLL